MKTLLNLIFLLAFCVLVSAQKTDTLKTKSSARLFENKLGGLQNFEAPKAPIHGFGSFSLDPKPEYIFPYKLPELSISPKKEINMMINEEFANNSERTTPTINKMNRAINETSLGDLVTKSERITIICRDFGAVDGDRVRIFNNNVIIAENVYLAGNYQSISIDLKVGFNTIDIQALNQGAEGYNTAEFKVFDQFGKLIGYNQWNLETGYRATLLVVRQ